MAEIDLYLILIASIGFDLLIGDPQYLLHPVQVIGIYIKKVTNLFIYKFNKDSDILFYGGLFISLSTIFLSYLAGKFIEIIYFKSMFNNFSVFFLMASLSSCLASKSLISSVKEISNLAQNQYSDRAGNKLIIEKVKRIVGRDVDDLSFDDLLRASTESLTENSVDGIFAPLFWIFLGTLLIKYSIYFPGPLSLGFAYKAISTLDSMVGYKDNYYLKLGFFSAKIEDYATFLPCKLVVFTLPLLTNNCKKYFYIIKKVFKEGSRYESPNAGFSEGVFAHVAGIKLGGESKYNNILIFKPILNEKGSNCDVKAINKICILILKLEFIWVLFFSLIYYFSLNFTPI